MKIKDLLVIMGIIGMIAVAISMAISELGKEYNQNIDVSKIDEFNNVEKMANTSEALYETIKGGGFSLSSLGGLIIGGIGVFFNMVLTIIFTPIEWIVSVAEIFGIPPIFTYSAISIFIIAVVIAVVAAVLKTEP